MADFEIAFDETMIKEGGYVNDPDDSGGETFRGIARNFHADWEGWKTVDQIKADNPQDFKQRLLENAELDQLVKSFYRLKFWTTIQGDKIPNQHLANEIFDSGVNQGISSASKMLQESLNLLNRNQKDYADVAVDGSIGSETLEALDRFLKVENDKPDVLLKMLNLMQGMKYIEIMRSKPSQQKFARGWLSRVKLSP